MKPLSWFVCLLLLFLTLFLPTTSIAAVTVGQIDTFEDGTTQNWEVALLGAPHPAPPVNIPSGGPGGVDDNYLQLSAIGGSGPGNRLTVINFIQWAGNYLAAGVGAIAMDLNNLGTSDLSLRLLFSDPNLAPPTNLAFSTDPIFLPAGSGWNHVVFPITPADLTAGVGNVVDALTGATELRIFHSTTATFPGEAVVASLGIDNVTAVPVPTGLLLLGSGVLTLAALSRRF
jgi:hypothetical protein